RTSRGRDLGALDGCDADESRLETTMGVICHHTMSLDGYVSGPDDSIDWACAFGEPTSLAERTMKRIGAILAGRRWYDLAIERRDGIEGIYSEESSERSRQPRRPSETRTSRSSGQLSAVSAAGRTAR